MEIWLYNSVGKVEETERRVILGVAFQSYWLLLQLESPLLSSMDSVSKGFVEVSEY